MLGLSNPIFQRHHPMAILEERLMIMAVLNGKL